MAAVLRLAVAQSPADLATPAERLAWLSQTLPEVAAAGADLLLLPELFACGYNIGALLAERAEPQDGAFAKAIAALAREAGIAIHYGFAERAGAQVFSAALCIGPDGKLLGHHRKLVVPPGFERDHFVAGRGCRLFTYRGYAIATLICYDAEFAETARHVAGLGADLILVPTALGAAWDWVASTMIPTRAYENGVFLAYANSAGTENGFSFLGKSLIAAPDGKELARAGHAPEVLYADLDRARVQEAQARLPYLNDRSSLQLD